MKKLIVLLAVCGLILGITAEAATTKKTVKKIVKKRVVRKVVPRKAAPRRLPVAPLPPPPPMAPLPPPPPLPAVARTAPAPKGIFGWKINSSAALGYIMGKSAVVGRADLILDGAMLGLSAKAINYRVGLGGATGSDINDNTIKAIPLFFDAILNLPTGGAESYIGGGLNYTLYGTDKVAGTYGGEIFVGVKGDLGLGGKSFAELNYMAIRCGDTNKRSAKGVGVSFGQEILL